MRVAYLTELLYIEAYSAWLAQFTTGVGCTWLYTVTVIKGVRSYSYLYAFWLLLPLGYVGGE